MLKTKAFDAALRLLSRREHGASELTNKLVQKGYTRHEAEQALEDCQQQGLQSDKRFVNSLVRVRVRQGYGIQSISQELQAKQVDVELLDVVLQEEPVDWFECALAVWQKKVKAVIDLDFAGLQKMKRFLLYRGFTTEIINRVVAALPFS